MASVSAKYGPTDLKTDVNPIAIWVPIVSAFGFNFIAYFFA